MKQLPKTTKPIVSVAGLRSEDIVSVSETKTSPKMRVFRYQIRASYPNLLDRLKKSLPASEGWHVTVLDRHETDFWRDIPRGHVAFQGLLVFDTGLRNSKWAPAGLSPVPPSRSHGWVWISYNERPR